VLRLTRQRRCSVAVAVTAVVLTGCLDEGRTDRTEALDVARSLVSSPPVDPSTTTTAATASPTDGADVTAAEFTRSLFGAIRGDDPGCTVAVGRDGEVVFAEAYGAARLDPIEPMTVDTVVDIASVSKQFTATAILLLAERGTVDLDAPLATYLPDLPAWAARPTVAQLIHHDSGIPDYIDLLVDRGFAVTRSSPTEADALAALGDVPDLDFAPGSRWEYSNSNYFLLSQVVLAVTGDDLGTFLADEVFEPLDLDMVMDPIAAIEEKAVSYERVNGEWQVADSRWEPTIGAGSIQTTPSQLVAWAAQYWEPTIGATTIDAERFEDAVDTGRGGRYGAGIFELDVEHVGRVLTHDGAWGGFFTMFAVAPAHRVAVAVSCTSPDSKMRQMSGLLEARLLAPWIGSD
jgi:CubicO group peptidase (beta-lactamase class C family)